MSQTRQNGNEPSVKKGFTRRRFTIGAAAAAAATAVASRLSGCAGSGDDAHEPQVITDDNLIVNVTEEYESAETDLVASQQWTLPLGTVLYHTGGSYAAAMLAPESAKTANSLGMLNLYSGNLLTMIETPTKGTGYDFYDVRCTDTFLAWVEIDYSSLEWYLYAQSLQNGVLAGDVLQLDHGSKDFDPPLFTASGNSAYWYKQPSLSGNKTTEASRLYRRNVVSSKGKKTEVCSSTGRFACRPRVSDGYLVATPRVHNSEGIYYGLTAFNTKDEYKQAAQLVLPSSVKPFEAQYMDDQFVFSIEAAYNGVGNLGNMGTFFGNEGGPFIFLSREPLASVAGKKGRYLVKVQSSHFVVNTTDKAFATLLSPDRSLDYGDYPASEGTTDWFLTYATVRNDSGIPENVVARLFTL